MRHFSRVTARLRRQSLLVFLLGIGFALLVGAASLARVAPIERLDHAWLDLLLPRIANGRPAQDTVVVDIDDVSLAALGQWPWPRYRIAALIGRIAAAQPAALALDILFPEADRASLANVQQTFKRDFGVDMQFSGVPEGLLDNDGYLGSEIARHRVVGSNYFYFDHAGDMNGAPASTFNLTGRTDLLALSEATGTLVNAPVIAAGARSNGFVNSQLDADGVLRRAPLLIGYRGAIHPNLALAALLRSLDLSDASIDQDENGLGLQVGAYRIPIDSSGHATLGFNGGPDRYRSISVVDVLSGKVDPAEFKGKIVFVGTTAVGLNDFHSTPLHARFPGLKIQSVMAEDMLHNGFVTRPVWDGAAVFAACLFAGGLAALLFVFARGTSVMLAGGTAGALMLLGASAWLLAATGRFVSAAAPVVVLLVLFGAFLVVRWHLEKRRAHGQLLQLENARKVTMESMAAVAETRDPETGAHIKRTQHYVRAVALELQRGGYCRDILTAPYIELLFLSAPLHDIGKVGVPDHILLKPGRLTPVEMTQMKQHAAFGQRIISSTAQGIDGDNFLRIAGEIAGTHHEKWDGSGYPAGLAGADIPLSGRIMAVADIYDALISRRCYKEPFSHAVATTLMSDMRGSTFDPMVLDAFFRIEDEIKHIAALYRDEAEGLGVHAPAHDVHQSAPIETRLDALVATLPRVTGMDELSS